MGNIIVGGILFLCLGLAARSIYKENIKGAGCGCSGCSGCSGCAKAGPVDTNLH